MGEAFYEFLGALLLAGIAYAVLGGQVSASVAVSAGQGGGEFVGTVSF